MKSIKSVPVSIWLAVLLMFAAVGGSVALKSTIRMADTKPKLVLDRLAPVQFGEWRELRNVAQVLPDPTVQAMLDSLYSQTLSRTYVNSKGQQVMLTIAYGNDQSSEVTAAHRPEFCYRGAGFDIKDIGIFELPLASSKLKVRHLIGTRGQYTELISYWVTLDETATLPGLGRKLAQLRYGLRGLIADGMLVRVSTPGSDLNAGFGLQEAFIRDFRQQLPDEFKPRFVGK